MDKFYLFIIISAMTSSVTANAMPRRATAQNPELCEGQLRMEVGQKQIEHYVSTFYRQRMREMGITQEQMAVHLGRTAKGTNHMLSGRTKPTIADIFIMRAVLNLSIEETFPPNWLPVQTRGQVAAPEPDLTGYVLLTLLDRVYKVLNRIEPKDTFVDEKFQMALDITVTDLGNNKEVSDEQVVNAVLTRLFRMAQQN